MHEELTYANQFPLLSTKPIKTISIYRFSLGTLSNHDDDGSENVAKKMSLSSFKLSRVFLDPIKCQMQETFPGVDS